jgi:hypothetical protein
MRLTIVAPDNLVIVDGRALRVDCTSMRPEIRAVQWPGAAPGHLEFFPGTHGEHVANQPIDGIAEFQSLIDAHAAAAHAIDNAPGATLSELKVGLRMMIDIAAERERLRHITSGSGQTLVYQAKRGEALRWDAAGRPAEIAAECYPWAAARASDFNLPIALVLAEWLALSAAWEVAGRAIESVREGAKAAIDAAVDRTAVEAAYAGIVWPEPASGA